MWSNSSVPSLPYIPYIFLSATRSDPWGTEPGVNLNTAESSSSKDKFKNKYSQGEYVGFDLQY